MNIDLEMSDQLITLLDKAFAIVQKNIENEQSSLILTKTDLIRYFVMRGALKVIKSEKL